MLDAVTPTRATPLPLPDLYARVERHVPAFEWPALADDIAAILKLKRERNAVILAHNYQTPDIFHTVGDIVGDSLALAREAARTDASVIVLAGVHFMAETAKLLNPEKTVLIPDLEGRVLAGRVDHRRRRAADARAPSRRADRHLCQHLGRGEGGKRHLLHLGQRQEDRRGARRAEGHHDPGRISRPQHRGPDQGRDHRLEGPLRGARALHRRGHPRHARDASRGHRAGASGMPARGRRRMRLHRLDRGDGRLCRNSSGRPGSCC